MPEGGKIVTVLSHYRLGALGWMSHPGFVDTSAVFKGFESFGANPGSGNYGMMDVLFALKFMQRNAEEFGGDANKINLFGESAGAAHVMSLLASPMTVGLVK